MNAPQLIYGDRRADTRYGLAMPLRFLYSSRGCVCVGTGLTIDLARKGVRFLADDPPPEGTELELRIEWPFLLQNVCPLELRIWGRVLRIEQGEAVISMAKYEFHTCGERSFDQLPEQPLNLSIVA